MHRSLHGVEGSELLLQELIVDDKVVGQLTSVGVSAELGGPVALGYATRAVDTGATVTVGSADAVVRELPLVS